jgi:type I restriction enzyme M protein
MKDYISGVEVRETPEEVNAVQVFSRILVEDYKYPKENIRTRPQFRVKARPSDTKKEYPVDIAVFNKTDHTDDNLYIIVECKKPNRKDGRRQLEIYMQLSKARLGVWYNGEQKLCLLKKVVNGGITFEEIPNIPEYGERIEDVGMYRRKNLKSPHNLKSNFKDIHNYFAANNVGTTLPEMFAQQFINLLFCKIYDERFTKMEDIVRFRAGINEKKAAVAERIRDIFADVKEQYADVFSEEDAITLDDGSIAYAVAQLQPFCIKDSKRDAIGDAFESFIDYTTKGSQGQFFTPRNVVKLMVNIAQVSYKDKMIDPACGTGGFLIEGLKTEWATLEQQYGEEWPKEEIFAEEQKIAIKNIRGIDKDSFLGKVAKAYMALMGDGRGGIFCENSLVATKFWGTKTQDNIREKSFDLVLTNPPFGKKLKIDETEILSLYNLGYKWKKNKDKTYERTDVLVDAQPPQILFIERCLNLLNSKGRMCFVSPESIFCNPSHKHIVQYIKERAKISAIISMPEDLFQPYTHAKTCVVYLQKGKSSPDDKIFMAIARYCGHDSRGNETSRDDVPLIQEKYNQYIKDGHLDYDHLGFVITESEIKNNIYIPKYYNPEIEQKLQSLSDTHKIVSIGELEKQGVISIEMGDEVSKESYGTGTIPFIRTSDIANWEIKLDPKQGLSRDIYEKYKEKQDVKANDILMVRDGTYLVGTCALITDDDKEIVFQSHIYKIRVEDPNLLDPLLLLALLSCPLVRSQIFAKRFTQDIIDTLGERIHELQLPIPKERAEQLRIANEVKKIIQYKKAAKEMTRKVVSSVVPSDTADSKFMTLIVD